MFVVKRKNIVIISVFIVTIITFVLCFFSLRKKPLEETSANIVRVVLDAGHGGIDGGVSGVTSGAKESDINLSVVKKLEKYLVDAGMSVTLTRNSSAGLYGIASASLKMKDMQKRRDIINKASPNLVVSVHMNKYSVSTRRGAQVFYKDDGKSKHLADCIQRCFNDMETATRQYSALEGDYYILNCTPYPSVIAECGFLSNPEEEQLLITEEYQDTLAYTIFKGIVGYLAKTSFRFF